MTGSLLRLLPPWFCPGRRESGVLRHFRLQRWLESVFRLAPVPAGNAVTVWLPSARRL